MGKEVVRAETLKGSPGHIGILALTLGEVVSVGCRPLEPCTLTWVIADAV